MTTFRPGDLAQVVPGGELYRAELEPGDLVLVESIGDGHLIVSAALGEPDRQCAAGWAIDPDALRLVPADEQGDTPAPSPLDRLITAVLESRVSIEQQWHDPRRTTYRIVIEEKA